jgi:KDO2-lipid IV(A) lauroyltransferase
MVHLLEYLLMRCGLAAFQAIPYRACLRLARGLGRAVWALDGRHRRRAIEHLKRAYGPAMTDARAEALSKEVFDTMARHAAEFVHLPRRGPSAFRLENTEAIERAKAAGTGILVVSAHHGPFSLLGRVARRVGVSAAVVIKRQKNARVMAWAKASIERHLGVEVLIRNDARQAGPEVLKAGRVLVLFADQHPPGGGIPARFFGLPVEAAAGPAIFARRHGCPMVVLTIAAERDGGLVARFDGPVSTEGTTEDLSQRWLDLLEARIREHPGQWMWMHRRWRD